MKELKATKSWFEVDRDGLAKLRDGAPKSGLLFELIQNAWDTDAKEVWITLGPSEGLNGGYALRVEDDDPVGFVELSHAYTLFAPSTKKGNAEQRGRFNLGEKLVLASCHSAWIETTTGRIEFDPDGMRVELPGQYREAGSVFHAELELTDDEYQEILRGIAALIPPPDVETYFNGRVLRKRIPVAEFKAVLPSVTVNARGGLTGISRRAWVRLYEPEPGETPTIYEMGIPVVASGDRFHADIAQKVPVTLDRTNVTPAFLRKLREEIVANAYALLSKEEAAAPWVAVGIENPDIPKEAAEDILRKRFGEKIVGADPTDPEAVARAVANGYGVVYGGALSSAAWDTVKGLGLVPRAGALFPTHGEKVYGEPIPEEDWKPSMVRTAKYAKWLSRNLLGFEVRVQYGNNAMVATVASYGAKTLTLNVGRLGWAFLDRVGSVSMNDLFLHEFAHEFESNHLSERYYDALSRLGALFVEVLVRNPMAVDELRAFRSSEVAV